MPAESVEPFPLWRALMAEPDVAGWSPAMRGRLSSPRLPISPPSAPELSFELHAMMALAASPEQQCEGLLLRYYPRSNTAVISHIMLRVGRNIGLILDKARDVLDRCAQERGFLSGCNCVFLEIETTQTGRLRAEE